MFELNEVLVYGNNGVCKLEDIRQESVMGTAHTYYILAPVYDDRSKFYVPVANKALTSTLRPVMMKETLHQMLMSIKNSVPTWEKDDRKRSQHFHDIVVGGMSEELLTVMKELVIHKKELQHTVKRLHASDEKVLSVCKKIVGEEFAYAFGVDVKDALDHIESEFVAG